MEQEREEEGGGKCDIRNHTMEERGVPDLEKKRNGSGMR
jgi:hypothetical protein